MAIVAAIPASWASPVIRAAGHIWGIRISRAHAVAAAATAEAAWEVALAAVLVVPLVQPVLARLALVVDAAVAGAISGEIGSVMHRGKLQWVLLLHHNKKKSPQLVVG